MDHNNNIDTFRNTIIFTENLNIMSTASNQETTYDEPRSFKYITTAGITYVFYDTKYNTILRENLNIVVSREAIAEFENDFEVINVLYTKELKQIFEASCEDEVATRCMELFDTINASTLSICLELLTTRPAALQLLLSTNVTSDETPDPANAGCSTDPANAGCSTDPIEMRRSVLPLLFSYDLLFFTHICMGDLFIKGEIDTLHLDTLCDAIRKYI